MLGKVNICRASKLWNTSIYLRSRWVCRRIYRLLLCFSWACHLLRVINISYKRRRLLTVLITSEWLWRTLEYPNYSGSAISYCLPREWNKYLMESSHNCISTGNCSRIILLFAFLTLGIRLSLILISIPNPPPNSLGVPVFHLSCIGQA